MKDTEIILTAEFETLLQTSSKDITELCRKEKSAWNKLDSLEEECQNIVKSVKTKTENLVGATLINNVTKSLVIKHMFRVRRSKN